MTVRSGGSLSGFPRGETAFLGQGRMFERRQRA